MKELQISDLLEDGVNLNNVLYDTSVKHNCVKINLRYFHSEENLIRKELSEEVIAKYDSKRELILIEIRNRGKELFDKYLGKPWELLEDMVKEYNIPLSLK